MTDLLRLTEWRQAARRLLRTPLFAATVLALLGLGFGALLTLATAVSSLRLGELPYPQGDRLAEVRGWSANMQSSLGYAPGLLDALEALPQVEALAVYDHGRPVEVEGGAMLATALVGDGLLELLGARALHGRLLGASDAGSDAVLLSESAWRGRFGADPDVVGSQLRIDGVEARVVGVLAEPFRFPHRATALWRPLQLAADARTGPGRFGFGSVQALVRLAEGASTASLQQAVDAQFAAEPGMAATLGFMQLQAQVQTLRERWAAEHEQALLLLAVAVLLVLLMLSANLAGLWLERGLRRRRELAVRAALGASAARNGTGVFAEVALLCALSVVAGLALVAPGLSLLESLGLLDSGTPWRAHLDLPVVALGLGFAAVLALVLSAAPVLVARRAGGGALHAAAPLAGGGRDRARRALVAVQVALAVTLLAGGVLLGQSLRALLAEDLGFQAHGLAMAQLHDRSNDPASAPVRRATLLRQAAALPGVHSASFSNAAPFSGSESVSTFADPARPEQPLTARDRVVGADYFRTLQIPLLRGRGFETAAAAHGGSVVVDELLADRLFGDADPLGRRIGLPVAPGRPQQTAQIVGVVATVRHLRVDEQPDLGTVYRVAEQPSGRSSFVLLRTDAAAAALGGPLREAADALGLRIAQVQAATSVVRGSLSQRVPLLRLLLGFAVAGVLLAAVGLFALVAFSVQRRRAEFGLRLAMGASPAALRRLALRDALHVLLPGLLAGSAGALLAGRLLDAQLYAVSPADPLLIAGVLLATAACLLPACAWPAWRAARVDPNQSLRCE